MVFINSIEKAKKQIKEIDDELSLFYHRDTRTAKRLLHQKISLQRRIEWIKNQPYSKEF